MAKNIFDSLSPATAFASKLFAAAGLDFSAMLAKGDETALKTHLAAQLAAQPSLADAIQQATAQLQTDLAARETALATLNAQLAATATAHTADLAASETTRATLSSQLSGLVTTLNASGIKLTADSAPAAIGAAVEARISMRAGEELAKHGLKSFPEQTVTADAAAAPQQTAKSELKGLAKVQAAWSSHKG